MKRRAYIHIGLHKTGTTSIQRWLGQNAKTLDAHGLAYPFAGLKNSKTRNHQALATGQVKRAPVSDHANWRALVKEVRGLDRDIILSAEGFPKVFATKAKIREIQEFLADLGYDTVFVIFLRDVAGYANSRYVQEIKRFLFEGSLEDFLIKKSKLFDYDRILRPFWGTADIRVVGFDRKQPVLAKLFDAIGLDDLKRSLTDADLGQRSNTSVGPLTMLAAERIIRKSDVLPTTPHAPGMRYARQLLRNEGTKLGWNDQGYCGFDEQRAQEFRELYAPKTTEIAKKLSISDWSEFVPPEKLSLNVVEPNQLTSDVRAQLNDVERMVLEALGHDATIVQKATGRIRRSIGWL